MIEKQTVVIRGHGAVGKIQKCMNVYIVIPGYWAGGRGGKSPINKVVRSGGDEDKKCLEKEKCSFLSSAGRCEKPA